MALSIHSVGRIVNRRMDGEPSVSLLPLCNFAGRQLVSMNEWNWLLRPPSPIRLRAGSNWCDLPDDFGREVTPQGASAPGWSSFKIVSPHQLAALRGASVSTSSPFRFYATLVYAKSDTGELRPRLELHEPSGETTTDLSLWYYAKWTDLEGDDDIIPIPAYMEMLFIEIVCAFALGFDEHDSGTVIERLAPIRMSPAFMDCVAEDALQISSPEPQSGGMVQGRGSFSDGWQYYPNGPVTLG